MDQGNETYDVALELDAAGEPVTHTCDCAAGKKFCAHKAAVLLHLTDAAPAKEEKVKGRAKKRSELEQLLDEVTEKELRSWVADVLATHKDISLAFRTRFLMNADELNPKKIRDLSAEASKTVAGRQFSVDATQVAKLVTLWTNIHRTALDRYLAAPFEAAPFALLQAVLQSVDDFLAQHQTNSKKLQQYLDGIQAKIVLAIKEVAEAESWTASVAMIVNAIGVSFETLAADFYLQLLNRLCSVESEERRIQIATLFGNALPAKEKLASADRGLLAKAGVQLLRECGVLQQHLHRFPFIPWSNEYNLLLIGAHVEAGNIEAAQKLAWQAVESNRDDVYNIPYLRILDLICNRAGDEAQRTKALQRLILLTPSMEAYAVLRSSLGADQLKELRSRLLSRANSSLLWEWRCFGCSLMAEDKNWKKMIAQIDKTPFPSAIRPWLQQLADENANLLVNKLMEWVKPWQAAYAEDDPEAFDLVEDLLAMFGRDAIKSAVRRHGLGHTHTRTIWLLAKKLTDGM